VKEWWQEDDVEDDVEDEEGEVQYGEKGSSAESANLAIDAAADCLVSIIVAGRILFLSVFCVCVCVCVCVCAVSLLVLRKYMSFEELSDQLL